ncbi:hypothetical protein [Streptomyces antimycoticus]|uniref:hypothetical protein n=1 Tax=Streptomyces antimycoticus TaxID=68175 RepID=UPI001386C90B|nr:hypothetical protein [Streptomyces antimycoticus]
MAGASDPRVAEPVADVVADVAGFARDVLAFAVGADADDIDDEEADGQAAAAVLLGRRVKESVDQHDEDAEHAHGAEELEQRAADRSAPAP